MLLFLALHLMCFEEERLLGGLSRHHFRPQTKSLIIAILQYFWWFLSRTVTKGHGLSISPGYYWRDPHLSS